MNVEGAFKEVADEYCSALERVKDPYLAERVHDIRDVTSRVLDNLAGVQDPNRMPVLREPSVVVGHELAPSQTAMLDRALVLGLATETGGRTSHTAILARSLKLPAVVGLKQVLDTLVDGEPVLVDGYNGLLIANPTDQTLFEYGEVVKRHLGQSDLLAAIKDSPAVTLDNHRVVLAANIEQAEDVEAVHAAGAEGVGLFRTEFLFLNRQTLPAEDEQFEAYVKVARAVHPKPVIIRTLDIGGDKLLTHSTQVPDLNPFLGCRAIRFCLQERPLFKVQLRAILRASVGGNVKLMFPMVSGVEELDQALAVLAECREELIGEGRSFDAGMDVGIMVEIPSAVVIAPILAQRVKFFSIGTNDLIQYTLAVDRLNERIAHLYTPTHPAIVRLIWQTVEAAHLAGIWVGVCGEMAGDPELVPLLLGLGVDEMSASPGGVPGVKYLVRRLKMSEAREVAEFALNCGSAAEILQRSRALARKAAPDLLESAE